MHHHARGLEATRDTAWALDGAGRAAARPPQRARSTIFRQFLWQRAAELDLTYAQGQVLFHVAAHPGCRMGDVGKAFGVTLPAVTHLVDRLEQKDFITRAGDPADRRAYVLEVTRAGGG